MASAEVPAVAFGAEHVQFIVSAETKGPTGFAPRTEATALVAKESIGRFGASTVSWWLRIRLRVKVSAGLGSRLDVRIELVEQLPQLKQLRVKLGASPGLLRCRRVCRPTACRAGIGAFPLLSMRN
jgi:hypothetical protein